MAHNPDELAQIPLRVMTRGQRISASKRGIIMPVRSERERQLRARYGLTLEDYDALFEQGHGVCWICKRTWENHLYVDHDHMTNQVRGLLCAECNTFVGMIERSLERALNAYMYIFPELFEVVRKEAYQ